MARAVALVTATLLATSSGAPALAQPTAADRQAAGDLVKKAIAKGQAGDHQGAVETYLQAYGLIPQPVLLSNIGSEYQQAGKPVEALKYFCMYLDKDPTGASAPYATAQAKVLQIQLGNKSVDDRAVCAPAKPKAPAAPIAPVRERDDGPVTGTANLQTREGTTSAGGGAGLRYAGIGVGLVGIAGLGVSAYYIHRSRVLNDAVENKDRGPYDDDVQAEQDEGPKANTRAWVFGVGGAALVAGGVIMYFVGKSKHGGESTAVTLAPTHDGFVVAGHF